MTTVTGPSKLRIIRWATSPKMTFPSASGGGRRRTRGRSPRGSRRRVSVGQFPSSATAAVTSNGGASSPKTSSATVRAEVSRAVERVGPAVGGVLGRLEGLHRLRVLLVLPGRDPGEQYQFGPDASGELPRLCEQFAMRVAIVHDDKCPFHIHVPARALPHKFPGRTVQQSERVPTDDRKLVEHGSDHINSR